MGGRAGKKLSNQQVQRFVQQTQLQPYVIQQIYDAFIDRAGKNGRMNLGEFKQAYNQIKPNLDPYNIYANDMQAEQIFMMFDADRNGKCTNIRRIHQRIYSNSKRHDLNIAKCFHP
ncbi:hypothetical protein I4U23_006365 [Adineta vaga]|nr:hypothetical protein I4U23_006365 [Adineta vaga]